MRTSKSSVRTRTTVLVAGTAGVAFVALLALAMTVGPRTATAMVPFTVQTGVACIGCHTNPPDKALNSQGEKFKACGYKWCKPEPFPTRGRERRGAKYFSARAALPRRSGGGARRPLFRQASALAAP